MKRMLLVVVFVLLVILTACGRGDVSASTSYSFHPHTQAGQGFGSNTFIGDTTVQYVLTFIVFLGSILVSMGYIMHVVQSYYLNKNLSGTEREPYIWVKRIWQFVMLTTVVMAFFIVFSLWYVILALWVTSLLGYLVYKLFGKLEARRFQPGDMGKAFTLSSSVITLILLLFVS